MPDQASDQNGTWGPLFKCKSGMVGDPGHTKRFPGPRRLNNFLLNSGNLSGKLNKRTITEGDLGQPKRAYKTLH